MDAPRIEITGTDPVPRSPLSSDQQSHQTTLCDSEDTPYYGNTFEQSPEHQRYDLYDTSREPCDLQERSCGRRREDRPGKSPSPSRSSPRRHSPVPYSPRRQHRSRYQPGSSVTSDGFSNVSTSPKRHSPVTFLCGEDDEPCPVSLASTMLEEMSDVDHVRHPTISPNPTVPEPFPAEVTMTISILCSQAQAPQHLSQVDPGNSEINYREYKRPGPVLRPIMDLSIPSVSSGLGSGEHSWSEHMNRSSDGVDSTIQDELVFIGHDRSQGLAAGGRYQNLAADGRSQDLAADDRDQDLAADGRYQDLSADGSYQDLAANGRYQDLSADGRYQDLAAGGAYQDLDAHDRSQDLAADSRYQDLSADGKCQDLAADDKSQDLAADGRYQDLTADGRYQGLTANDRSQDLTADVGSQDLTADSRYRDLAAGKRREDHAREESQKLSGDIVQSISFSGSQSAYGIRATSSEGFQDSVERDESMEDQLACFPESEILSESSHVDLHSTVESADCFRGKYLMHSLCGTEHIPTPQGLPNSRLSNEITTNNVPSNNIDDSAMKCHSDSVSKVCTHSDDVDCDMTSSFEPSGVKTTIDHSSDTTGNRMTFSSVSTFQHHDAVAMATHDVCQVSKMTEPCIPCVYEPELDTDLIPFPTSSDPISWLLNEAGTTAATRTESNQDATCIPFLTSSEPDLWLLDETETTDAIDIDCKQDTSCLPFQTSFGRGRTLSDEARTKSNDTDRHRNADCIPFLTSSESSPWLTDCAWTTAGTGTDSADDSRTYAVAERQLWSDSDLAVQGESEDSADLTILQHFSDDYHSSSCLLPLDLSPPSPSSLSFPFQEYGDLWPPPLETSLVRTNIQHVRGKTPEDFALCRLVGHPPLHLNHGCDVVLVHRALPSPYDPHLPTPPIVLTPFTSYGTLTHPHHDDSDDEDDDLLIVEGPESPPDLNTEVFSSAGGDELTADADFVGRADIFRSRSCPNLGDLNLRLQAHYQTCAVPGPCGRDPHTFTQLRRADESAECSGTYGMHVSCRAVKATSVPGSPERAHVIGRLRSVLKRRSASGSLDTLTSALHEG